MPWIAETCSPSRGPGVRTARQHGHRQHVTYAATHVDCDVGHAAALFASTASRLPERVSLARAPSTSRTRPECCGRLRVQSDPACVPHVGARLPSRTRDRGAIIRGAIIIIIIIITQAVSSVKSCSFAILRLRSIPSQIWFGCVVSSLLLKQTFGAQPADSLVGPAKAWRGALGQPAATLVRVAAGRKVRVRGFGQGPLDRSL